MGAFTSHMQLTSNCTYQAKIPRTSFEAWHANSKCEQHFTK